MEITCEVDQFGVALVAKHSGPKACQSPNQLKDRTVYLVIRLFLKLWPAQLWPQSRLTRGWGKYVSANFINPRGLLTCVGYYR